jgi:hypothetical protein
MRLGSDQIAADADGCGNSAVRAAAGAGLAEARTKAEQAQS